MVDELITIESVMEMLVLVEKYNIKDMKEALLLRMKSQVVDEKNFMGIVNQVEKLSYSSAVKDVMDRILYNYILDNYGRSVQEFARFLTKYEVKEDTLSYMMRMIGKSDNDDGNDNRMPQDSVRNTLTKCLCFSNFPEDQMGKMVDSYIEEGDI